MRVYPKEITESGIGKVGLVEKDDIGVGFSGFEMGSVRAVMLSEPTPVGIASVVNTGISAFSSFRLSIF